MGSILGTGFPIPTLATCFLASSIAQVLRPGIICWRRAFVQSLTNTDRISRFVDQLVASLYKAINRESSPDSAFVSF